MRRTSDRRRPRLDLSAENPWGTFVHTHRSKINRNTRLIAVRAVWWASCSSCSSLLAAPEASSSVCSWERFNRHPSCDGVTRVIQDHDTRWPQLKTWPETQTQRGEAFSHRQGQTFFVKSLLVTTSWWTQRSCWRTRYFPQELVETKSELTGNFHSSCELMMLMLLFVCWM